MPIQQNKIALAKSIADANTNAIYGTVYFCQTNQQASYFLAHSLLHSIGYVAVFTFEITAYISELYIFLKQEQKSQQKKLEMVTRSCRFLLIATALSLLPILTHLTPILYMASTSCHLLEMALMSIYDACKKNKSDFILHSSLMVADAYTLFACEALLVLTWHNPFIAIGAGLLCLVGVAFNLKEIFHKKAKGETTRTSKNKPTLFQTTQASLKRNKQHIQYTPIPTGS